MLHHIFENLDKSFSQYMCSFYWKKIMIVICDWYIKKKQVSRPQNLAMFKKNMIVGSIC